jgi:A/G-specific adenine glycosylase
MEKKLLRARLLAWYDGHRRDLPWRRTRHAYRIWISEIMLQQTRVAAVLGHYREFLRRFPSVQWLAAAKPASVLAAWSGLGYYRRALSRHAAARLIVRDHGGRFPRTAAEWRALPGIGRYTAAAIASIAFDEPAAVVDGNVERVLQRVMGKRMTVKALWQTADSLIDPTRPGDFNQAMMELGATVCLPQSPKCAGCPLARGCKSRGAVERGSRAQRQRRNVSYGLHTNAKAVLLVRRPADESLMPGMWELPEVRFRPQASYTPALQLRHSIMNTDYVVSVLRQNGARPARGQWVPRHRLPRMPLTGLARKILRRAAIIE